MAEAIFLFILFVPLSVLTFFAPEETMLRSRWQYDQEPEFSREAILIIKILSAVVVILSTLNLIINIINAFR
ncbi:hypothetical protein [Sporosarcina highlanderae]|uniref:DUF6199 domain-containing protein n=1 Tax=Sporosarcina highlanderae TaxID=3035916 RepID=A0ABT8JWM5_9BACL|nr:hypothetical protein [Sporosarcina highlanderae]MDN4609208.1 hypothetical protein [Sporosarcina highlanderae]